MLQINKKVLNVLLSGLLICSGIGAATAGLVEKYLEKASTEYENGDTDTAFKYINQAMTLSKKDGIPPNVLYLAQTVYEKKLQNIKKTNDYKGLVDIQFGLEQYPDIQNPAINKLIVQIKAQQSDEAEVQRKTETLQQRNDEQNRFKQQQQALREEQEESRKNQQEVISKLDHGLQNLGNGLTKSAEETKKTSSVMLITVYVICGIILLIILLIVFIVHLGIKHQQVQQAQYVEAFKLLATNQSQTNRLMLGGVTDLYGSNGLKSAGSSRWGVDALPEPEETPEEKAEMRDLAAKCEDLGTKIDQATNRKNNSKNVSELVYKLAMKLGMKQRAAMVYFCAAMVYDAGFLAIDSGLLAAENLSDEDRLKLKHHVDCADTYLQFVPKRYWEVFADAANKHHENMDGSGYPEGLKGDEIPQVARLIRVAESFISVSSKRNYHEIADKETAIEKLKTQPQFYDPDVVAVLEDII
jgi:HD-GYP domain-containing protein (c-di-GMP phosphodiesterase class II)